MVEPSQDFITTVEESAEGTGNDSAPQSSKTSNKRPMALDDDDTDSQAGEDYVPPLKRFQPTNPNTENDWDLPEEMLQYIFDQFYQYNPDNVLENSIFKENPVPKNIPCSPPLDEFLREVLQETNKFSQMQDEKFLQKFQQRVLNIMGPLSRMWFTIEEAI